MSEPNLAEILNRLVVNSEKQEERFVAAQKQIADAQKQVADQQKQFAEQQIQIAEQQQTIADLLSTIKDPPTVNVAVNQPGPDARLVRAEKVQKISDSRYQAIFEDI